MAFDPANYEGQDRLAHIEKYLAQALAGGGAVSSVFGRTGTVTATADDYGTIYAPQMPGLVLPIGLSPLSLSAQTTVISANSLRGVRVVIPRTGTLHDLAIVVDTQSGNIEVGILDTSATTRNRLYTTGSVACPAGGVVWRVIGDPALAVTEGQELDFYFGADNSTVKIGFSASLANDPIATLPSSFLPVSGGGNTVISWSATGFPMGSTIAESSLTTQKTPVTIIGRVA